MRKEMTICGEAFDVCPAEGGGYTAVLRRNNMFFFSGKDHADLRRRMLGEFQTWQAEQAKAREFDKTDRGKSFNRIFNNGIGASPPVPPKQHYSKPAQEEQNSSYLETHDRNGWPRDPNVIVDVHGRTWRAERADDGNGFHYVEMAGDITLEAAKAAANWHTSRGL